MKDLLKEFPRIPYKREYLTWMINRGYSDKTQDTYFMKVDVFFKWYHKHQLGENTLPLNYVNPSKIDENDFADFRNYLKGKDESVAPDSRMPGTINGYITSIKNYWTFLSEVMYLDNKAKSLRSEKDNVQGAPKYIPYEDVLKILTSMREVTCYEIRNKAMLWLMFSTAMRAGEVVNCLVGDIDEACTKVIVRREKSKYHKERTPEINFDEATRILKRYINEVRPEMAKGRDIKYLFFSFQGKQLSTDSLNKVLKRNGKLANYGEDIHNHMLRHSLAMYLAEVKELPLYILQEYLGHDSIDTTKIYGKLSSEKVNRMVRKAIRG